MDVQVVNVLSCLVSANPTKKVLGCPPGLLGSELTLYGEVKGSTSVQSRPKVKTNGHFTSYMQVRTTLQLQCNAEALFRSQAGAWDM